MIHLMKRSTLLLTVLFCLCGAAFAQPGKLSFEVASIKPAVPMEMGRIRVGMNADGGMLRYTNVSLMDVIRAAYKVKEFQVEGPDWLNSARFDITAKFPDGATQDDVPQMLQALLEERFKLALHRDTKEHAVYALVAGKNGAKLKPAEIDPNAPNGVANAGAPPPPNFGAATVTSGGGASSGSASGGARTRTADEMVRAPGGSARPGAMMMMMGPNGMHLKAPTVTLAALADSLSRFSERPIVDQTGIQGQYDFDLEFMPENMGGMRRMAPMGAPRPAAGDGPQADPQGEQAGTIFEALQKYGLKLEPRKAPMEALVIDHIEKAPTEN